MYPSLAIALRDAGYPQEVRQGSMIHDFDIEPKQTYYEPTLGELIGACGFEFRDLVQHSPKNDSKPRWVVRGARGKLGHWKLFGAKFPIDAVAKLWLELHDHPLD